MWRLPPGRITPASPPAWWDIQFSLGPTFSYALKDQWDLDGSGTMSQNELLRAAYKGVFNLSEDSGGMVMYDLVKEKFNSILQTGAAATDYETMWNEGKVAMMEDGLWRLPRKTPTRRGILNTACSPCRWPPRKPRNTPPTSPMTRAPTTRPSANPISS